MTQLICRNGILKHKFQQQFIGLTQFKYIAGLAQHIELSATTQVTYDTTFPLETLRH
jgi:hypothetical protein